MSTISASGEIMNKVRIVSLHEICLLVLLFIPAKYDQIISKVWELWPAEDFDFRGDNYIMKTV